MFREFGLIIVLLLITAAMTNHYVGHQIDKKIADYDAKKTEKPEDHGDKCVKGIFRK